MKRRWYDNHQDTLDTLEIIRKLDREAREKLTDDIVEVAKQIKAIHREEEEPALSIGVDRVLGLYQSSNARRWYDKSVNLDNAIRTISTLPEDDFLNIMEGLCVSLSD